MSIDKPVGPICVRFPSTLRKTLDTYIESKDLVRSRYIRQAVVEKLRRDRAAGLPPEKV